MSETRISEWLGPHPGTGTNDHIHHWQEYTVDGRTIRACQVCGLPHPDDAAPMSASPIIIPELDEQYDGSEAQLDRFILRTRGTECDLCGAPFTGERGGPFDGGEDGHVCGVCRVMDRS